MTPFLFNLMLLAIVALKVLVMLLILNWIDREPKKDVDTLTNSPKTRGVSVCIHAPNIQSSNTPKTLGESKRGTLHFERTGITGGSIGTVLHLLGLVLYMKRRQGLTLRADIEIVRRIVGEFGGPEKGRHMLRCILGSYMLPR